MHDRAFIEPSVSGPHDRPLAPLLFALFLVGVGAVAARYVDLPLAPLPAVLPVFITAACLAAGIAAYLCTVRYRATQQPFHAALAAACAFTAQCGLLQAAGLCGEFFGDAAFVVGERAATIVWLAGHAGFALFVALAVVPRHPARPGRRRRRPASPLTASVAAAAVAAACAIIAASPAVPAAARLGEFDLAALHPAGIAVVCIQASVLVALVVATRCRNTLEQWLAVALLAGLVELVLGLLGGMRFGAGWYCAKALGLVGAILVPGVLVGEFAALYRRVLAADYKLSHLATMDALTGLPNRRSLDDNLAGELRRCSESGRPLALLLIDLDHFKPYNERYGAATGDATLVEVAEELNCHARPGGGMLARYDSDEFVVVLPDTSESAARSRAEAIRAGVAALAVPAGAGIGGAVTVSIGVFAAAPDQRVDPAGYLVRADQALHQAKRDGRNRVRLWHQSAADTLRLAVA